MSANGHRSKLTCLYTLLSCAIVVVFVLTQLVAWMPASQLFSQKTRGALEVVNEFTVQGWAFFTKSPRSESVVPYRYDDESNEWKMAARGPNVQFKYAFGLNRDSRLTEFDVQLLLADVVDLSWTSCENVAELGSCVSGIQSTVKTVNADNFELCGDIVLVKSTAVPWAYRNTRSGMPGEVTSMSVVCG